VHRTFAQVRDVDEILLPIKSIEAVRDDGRIWGRVAVEKNIGRRAEKQKRLWEGYGLEICLLESNVLQVRRVSKTTMCDLNQD
jgi:hypothetical protein